MHHHSTHSCVARNIKRRAEVIEIRMANEQCVHHSTSRTDPWKRDACSDATHRARPRIEQHNRVSGLHEVHGPIAERDHGASEVWSHSRCPRMKHESSAPRGRGAERKHAAPTSSAVQHEHNQNEQSDRSQHGGHTN